MVVEPVGLVQEEGWWSSGAQGSEAPPPEPTAEPTASSAPLAIQDKAYPTRNREEDLTALRAAAITPVSFAPHRHVMMALGRPVVVLFESLNAVGGMVRTEGSWSSTGVFPGVREVEWGRFGSGVVILGWVGLAGREERGCWNCVEMD